MDDWTEGYYGPLYRESVQGLLGPALSAAEAALAARLLAVGPRHRVLDLACGAGRHARPLAARAALVVGLERSAADLAEARRAPAPAAPGRAPRWVRADLRAPPFRRGAFDAVLSWYASLFMFDEACNLAALRGAAALLAPGGRLLVQHANPLALARRPVERAVRHLPGGGRVEEESRFDPATGLDRCARRLVRADGSTLDGTALLRYYTPTEWERLAPRAGLRLARITSSVPPASGPLDDAAPDLIALLEQP